MSAGDKRTSDEGEKSACASSGGWYEGERGEQEGGGKARGREDGEGYMSTRRAGALPTGIRKG